MNRNMAMQYIKQLVTRLEAEGVSEQNDALVAEVMMHLYDAPMGAYWIPVNTDDDLATDQIFLSGQQYAFAYGQQWASNEWHVTSWKIDQWTNADAVCGEHRWHGYDKAGEFIGTLRVLPLSSL